MSEQDNPKAAAVRTIKAAADALIHEVEHSALTDRATRFQALFHLHRIKEEPHQISDWPLFESAWTQVR